MNRIQIRQAVIGDENILAQIQVESWRAAYADILPREELEKHLELERIEQMYRRVLTGQQLRGSLLLLNDCPHCMAFWGGFRAEQRPGWAELVCIHSLPQNWGRGYGSMMMEHLLQQMRAAGYGRAALWAFEQNGRARHFYEKNGFLLASERKDSFGAKEVLYTRFLEGKGDTQSEGRNA